MFEIRLGFLMIEGLRSKALDSIFSMGTFQACWPSWRAMIADLTDDFSNATKIYDLGGRLREVFKLTAASGRDQGSLSGGGAAWEGLVCWYLNTVMTGSRAVVIKQRKNLMPAPLLNAMTITYKNVATNTESDLSGIVFPKDFALKSTGYNKNLLDEYIEKNIRDFSLHNIQCKTNWNDNAQIPMLWDMIYQFSGVESKNVHIGSAGFDLDDLAAFTYSFVTVPSQSKDIKANSMAVRRVESLSGGNYWGKPSAAGVAEGVSEIFKRVFKAAFDGDIKGHIARQIGNGSISLREP